MAERVIALADLAGHERILDLATGTGLIARTAAKFSTTVGADISWGALRQAQRQSAGQVSWIAGDAHELPFKDSCFDLVTCGISLSHFSEVKSALFEARRVLRPSGQFITSAWGNAGRSPAKEATNKVRDKLLADRETTYGFEFNESLWADPERGCEALQEAGFIDVRVSTHMLSGKYQDHHQALETVLAWPITRYRIEQLSPEEQEHYHAEATRAIGKVDDLTWQSEVHYYQGVNQG